MNKMFLIFSHKLTKEQVDEAKQRFRISEFVYLPQELQNVWSNVPTEGEIDDKYLDGIKEFILNNSSTNDYILIQGDFGATYIMIEWCLRCSLIPIYSTTSRVYEFSENVNGNIQNKHIFKHVNFRFYKK